MPKGIYDRSKGNKSWFKNGHKINLGKHFIFTKPNNIGKHMKGRKLSKQWKINISKGLKGKFIGDKSSRWIGGEISDNRGYILVYSPHHPYKDSKGYVRKHRLIMEQKIGRFLTPQEYIHHINGNRSDNRIENLKLFPNRRTHSENHRCKKTGRFTSINLL